MKGPRRLPPLSAATLCARAVALAGAALAAAGATVLLVDVALQDGFGALDVVRAGLILITTAWLAWGAMLAFTGLPRLRRPAEVPDIVAPAPRTVVLIPICNEDPVDTFARVAAIERSMTAADVAADIAILSDTREPAAAAREQAAFARLRAEIGGRRAVFYRQRADGRGRKAGNVEDFIRRSGAAYDFAVVLDADSLMEGQAIRRMVARMQADPGLGLLQTLPRLVMARSWFARAMQFAASFHGPVFTRGLARMQGATGPFWGHNAIFRVTAFAESCGLPELSGPPPLGGSILSHDYVEAALLARAGWKVEVDPEIGGSYEEGPENVFSYARRDRRWCQGNLQHMRLLPAPGIRPWSRFVFVQGIFSYLVALLWAAFLVTSFFATLTAPPPDYFPEPHLLFPVFPSDRTKELTALLLGIVGLLLLPKFAVLIEALASRRAKGHGGGIGAGASVLAEIVFSSLLAPVLLMFQLRAVLQVLAGRDNGWPPNLRGEGRMTIAEAIPGSLWIVATGAGILFATARFAPQLTVWMLPVCLPMMAAPVVIAISSRPLTHALFRTPEETEPPAVIRDFRAIAASWAAAPGPESPVPAQDHAHVAA